MTATLAMIQKIEKLSPDQYQVVSNLLDLLNLEAAAMQSDRTVQRKIGVAPQISVPSDFDDIDFGTEKLFGLDE